MTPSTVALRFSWCPQILDAHTSIGNGLSQCGFNACHYLVHPGLDTPEQMFFSNINNRCKRCIGKMSIGNCLLLLDCFSDSCLNVFNCVLPLLPLSFSLFFIVSKISYQLIYLLKHDCISCQARRHFQHILCWFCCDITLEVTQQFIIGKKWKTPPWMLRIP